MLCFNNLKGKGKFVLLTFPWKYLSCKNLFFSNFKYLSGLKVCGRSCSHESEIFFLENEKVSGLKVI